MSRMNFFSMLKADAFILRTTEKMGNCNLKN